MSLDHGTINLPLDKRGGGSLDAQIDKGLAAEKARLTEAKKMAHRQRVKAGEKLPSLLDNDKFIFEMSNKLKITTDDLREHLRWLAEYQPSTLLRVAENENV